MNTSDSLHVYDTSLRDGAQQQGLNLTVADKLVIARLLDGLGVGYIEGGWPGAIPKDTEFFARARSELKLRHATLTAFGATRRANTVAADDPQVAALRDAETPVVCLVAKSDSRHVERALRTTNAENLAMVGDTVEHLVAEGRRVFLDCEHFFDGYRHDPAYALEVVRVAADAGAEVVVLCDTNGGMLPHQVTDVVGTVASSTGARLGIHSHDDTGCAVANTLAAVTAGATHVQGTANGTGERCGNANLFTVVADLELKLGSRVLPEGKLAELSHVAHAVAEVTNVAPHASQPYVGHAAFAHKAGLHASAIKVDPMMYQHADPAEVGNDMRMLVSDMAGRASVELKGRELGFDLSDRKDTLAAVTEQVKSREAGGYTYDAADASFELILRDSLDGERRRAFEVESWRVIVDHQAGRTGTSEATVRLTTQGRRYVVTGEAPGPVDALNRALREALVRTFPELAKVELLDYKVRILEGAHGTDAVTRVLITTGDGEDEWGTVGVGGNILEASWEALEDALAYYLVRRGHARTDAEPEAVVG
ncbi:MAG: citramalate synthase [Streptosporangiales bacterium]|nr:citramalate synthase [Streptosporangiales bacterium]MBO0890224.1 citramalate synthase [Acidothermales bacterium]